MSQFLLLQGHKVKRHNMRNPTTMLAQRLSKTMVAMRIVVTGNLPTFGN